MQQHTKWNIRNNYTTGFSLLFWKIETQITILLFKQLRKMNISKERKANTHRAQKKQPTNEQKRKIQSGTRSYPHLFLLHITAYVVRTGPWTYRTQRNRQVVCVAVISIQDSIHRLLRVHADGIH